MIANGGDIRLTVPLGLNSGLAVNMISEERMLLPNAKITEADEAKKPNHTETYPALVVGIGL